MIPFVLNTQTLHGQISFKFALCTASLLCFVHFEIIYNTTLFVSLWNCVWHAYHALIFCAFASSLPAHFLQNDRVLVVVVAEVNITFTEANSIWRTHFWGCFCILCVPELRLKTSIVLASMISFGISLTSQKCACISIKIMYSAHLSHADAIFFQWPYVCACFSLSNLKIIESIEYTKTHAHTHRHYKQ